MPSLVHDSNIIENRMELPGTVTTVTNQDANVLSSSVVEQVVDMESDNNILNPLIGKKGSIYHCKEHPKFQNIHIEEVEHHSLYSKEH